jgi:2-polyprenyl-3-methyl-5-hydroxy-6-metoxy-1,4-benzoquinol methylase
MNMQNIDKDTAHVYNNLANEFSQYKNTMTTESIGYMSLIQLIGVFAEKSILDYGCWGGQILKEFNNKGASVMGTDTSSDMVKIASILNPNIPIIHIEKDAPFANITKDLFDAITMNYVLCVIENKEEIINILDGAYKALKKGGKVFIQNANRDKANGVDFKSFNCHLKEDLKDGDAVFVTLKGDEPLLLQDYFFSQNTYKKILHQVGFSNIIVHELFGDADDWRDMESKISPCYIIEATK